VQKVARLAFDHNGSNGRVGLRRIQPGVDLFERDPVQSIVFLEPV